MRTVPHDRGQLRALLFPRHAPGRDRVLELSRSDGRALRQRHPGQGARQSHPDRQPRLQRFGLSHHGQRESGRGRLQARHGEHLKSHAHSRGPYDGGGGGGRLRDLSRERALHGDDPEHRATRRRLSSDRLRLQAPDHWRLRQLPRDYTHVRNGSAPHSPEARQSHSHYRRMRAVPHDHGQLRALLRHRHAPGRDGVLELSRSDGRALR